MKAVFCLVFALVYAAVESKELPPKAQVYSRNPGVYGQSNILICHVSGFHPPDIKIDLLKNGAVMSDAKQTDLAFDQGWQFHLTKNVDFVPEKADAYACKVSHLGVTKTYTWDPDN